MEKKKCLVRELIWRTLRKNGKMTALQLCDILNESKIYAKVSIMSRTAVMLMYHSHLFEKAGEVKVSYMFGSTRWVALWRAKSISELVAIFTDPRRRHFGLPKVPRLIRNEIESRLEELP